MTECFLVQNGGGSPLNFQVVGGTTQPVSPKENMIWVNTDTAISSYVFSAEKPSDPVGGMVWIATGIPSTVVFSATKKNPIMVYPMSAKQYVGGAWVHKEVKSYQSGAWVDWLKYAFNHGDICYEITGGWVAQKRNTDINPVMPILTIENGVMSVNSYNATSLNYFGGTVQTVNKIDMSKFSAIRFHLTGRSVSSSRPIFLGVTTDATSAKYSFTAVVDVQNVSINAASGAWVELDVSSVDAECVIAINPRGQNGGSHTIYLDEIVFVEV